MDIGDEARQIEELVTSIVSWGFRETQKSRFSLSPLPDSPRPRTSESGSDDTLVDDDDDEDEPTPPPSRRDIVSTDGGCQTEPERRDIVYMDAGCQTDPGEQPATLKQLRAELAKLQRPQVVADETSSRVQTRHDPNEGLPINRPAVILSTNDPSVKSYKDVLLKFREGVDFTQKDFGPVRTKPLANNKCRIEFQTEAQRDSVINDLSSTSLIKAESARRLRPLIMVKGIPNEIRREDVVQIIAKQNPLLGVKSDDDAKFRFARNNRNTSMYNAVIEVSPSVRNSIHALPESRIHVSHLRVRCSDYVGYTQCYKCLQFGHTTKHCRATTDICSHCGSKEHGYAQCPTKADPRTLSCCNCKAGITANDDETSSKFQHSATSESECPRIHAVIKYLRSITDYGVTRREDVTVRQTVTRQPTVRKDSIGRARTNSTSSAFRRQRVRGRGDPTTGANRQPLASGPQPEQMET